MKLLSSATVLLTVSAGIPKCTLNPEASGYSSGDGPDEVTLPGQGEIYDFFKFNSATGKIELKFDFSAYDGECYLQPTKAEMSYLKNNCWDIRFADPVRDDIIPLNTTDIVLDDFYGEIRSGFNFFDFESTDNSAICSQVTMLMSEDDEQIFLMRDQQRDCAPVELESVELPGTCCDFSSFPSQKDMNLADYATSSCGVDNMKIEIDRCALVYYGFSIDDLNLNGQDGGAGFGLAAIEDDHCMGEISEDGDKFVWTMEKRDSCRTLREANSTHYTLSNAVSGRNGVSVGKITRIREAKVSFACTYPIAMTVSAFNSGYLQTVVPAGIVNLKTAAADFNYQLAIYKDALYTDFVSENKQFDVPERIYVGLLSDAPEDLKLGVDKCWLTGSADPNDELSYSFIENGCVSDAQVGSTMIIENFDNNAVRFSVESFLFEDDESSSLYLHCDVRLCKECDNTCDNAARKRRELLVLENTDDLIYNISLAMPIQTRKKVSRLSSFRRFWK